MRWIIIGIGIFSIGTSTLKTYWQYQFDYYSALFAQNQENKEVASTALRFMDLTKFAIFLQYCSYFAWIYVLAVVIERILQ